MTTKTSAVSPIRVGDSPRNRRTIYTAIEVTETQNTKGEPVYTTKIIRYRDQRKNGATTIATGTTENPGVFIVEASANSEEKRLLGIGGVFSKAIKQQVNSIKNEFGRSPLSAQQKEQLEKITSGASRVLVNPQGDQQGGARNASIMSNFLGGPLPDTGGRGSETPSTPLNPSQSGQGSGSGSRKSYSILSYPETINQNQDKLKISVLKFSPKQLSGLKFSDRSNFTERILGSVLLPVPTSVRSSNKTDFGDNKMDAAQIAGAGIAAGLIQGQGEGEAAINSALEGAGQGSAELKDAIKQYFVGQATGVKGILARTEGQVVNPNLELVFNGPTLRPFGFTFRMSPRDERESIIIKKIIRMFKQSMAPTRTESELFLKAPNTYKLQFLKGASQQDHDFLPRIKECALTSFDVNFTPDGNYATYRNSSMVAYELTFGFKELEPVFNHDYTDLDGDSDQTIGF